MKFFTSDDFEMQHYSPEQAAAFANGKLEREGKLFYCQIDKYGLCDVSRGLRGDHTHRALVINLGPLEKCKHEPHKIIHVGTYPNYLYYECECGAAVRPTKFEEVK